MYFERRNGRRKRKQTFSPWGNFTFTIDSPAGFPLQGSRHQFTIVCFLKYCWLAVWVSRFSLDKDTGVITLIARLDFETTQRYTLTVIARDGGGEETTGRVRINVLDVNDNIPTFQKESYLGALRENEPSVTQVVRVRVRKMF